MAERMTNEVMPPLREHIEMLESIPGYIYTEIHTEYTQSGYPPSSQSNPDYPSGPGDLPQPNAWGGLVTGGIPGQDSVPLLAMPGEFVVREAIVDQLGPAFFEALNRGRTPTAPNVVTINVNNYGGYNAALDLEMVRAQMGGV
jgi:hypothetical protein